MIIFVLISFYIIFFYTNEYFKRKQSPPGPWPIPVLGNLIQISRASKEPHLAVAKIANNYEGGLVRLKFGSQETLILSSYEVTKEFGNHPDANGRHLDGFICARNAGKKIGVIFSDGPFWDKKRAWIMKTLRGYGFSKSNRLESKTNEMVQNLIKDFTERLSSGDAIIDMNEFFTFPTFQVMWEMLVGEMSQDDKLDILRLLKKSEKMALTGTFGPGIIAFFPFMKYIMPGFTGYDLHVDFSEDIRNVGKELLQKAINRLSSSKEQPTSLTQAYAEQIITSSDTQNFNKDDFSVVFMDLVQGSTHTVSAFLESAVLFSILNPEKQDKIFQEIEKYIPKDQKPNTAHLRSMNYTQAFITEVHRLSKILPLLVPKRTTKDFFYKDYLIKKNTNTLTSIQSICHNKEVFGEDTEVFRPERYIDSDGRLMENMKHVTPFGIGRRTCPGVAYAEVVGFLVFINILREFKLATVPGKPLPTTEMNIGLAAKPNPFSISISKRVQ